MNIRLSRIVAEEIGLPKFEEFGINKDSWGWKNNASIDLTVMTEKQIMKLRGLISSRDDVRGTQVMIRDIDTWLHALGDEGSGSARARSCRQFKSLLIRLIGETPGHRVYKKVDDIDGGYICYYVNNIEYHPEEHERGYGTRPAFVNMGMIYESFGGKKEYHVSFHIEDIRGKKTIEALEVSGFVPETDELRATYLRQMKDFNEITKKIGTQYLARGSATDENMDGNPSGRDSSWYWRRDHVYRMEVDGVQRRVLIDVFKEENEKDRDRDVRPDTYFWGVEGNRRMIDQQLEKEEKSRKKHKKEEGYDYDDDRKKKVDDIPKEDLDEMMEDLDVEPDVIEIPIHPYVAVFDLKRHLRLKIHIDYLTEYIYDSEISEKLILPKYLKDLVAMLIEHKGATFNDIVEGKSGGAVVLLCGPPGTGKTLTAEVYAEAEHKGLYSVQCSQLGTDPENLEDELLKVFTRTQRWGAVLLLDEADVYVRQRGADLAQNAIVGVFLRVLEYQSNVLFLTTNRPEDVDDAIASRCVARLNYKVPNAGDQMKIWRVLADASDISLSEEVIFNTVADNPDLSGRDVKNLLKLAFLISVNMEIPISPKVVKFVRQFKPTQSASESSGDIVELDLKLGGKQFRPKFMRGEKS